MEAGAIAILVTVADADGADKAVSVAATPSPAAATAARFILYDFDIRGTSDRTPVSCQGRRHRAIRYPSHTDLPARVIIPDLFVG
ncbi:hypothetical protein JMUB6875_02580 [Nocardia sp. JMUB6875]